MSNLDLVLVLMGPLGALLVGAFVFFVARRQQRRFFKDHPELPNPFDTPHHHPAE